MSGTPTREAGARRVWPRCRAFLWREHDDTDISVLRDDLAAAAHLLAGWELWVGPDELQRFDGVLPQDANNVWAGRGGVWELDLTLGFGTAEEWVYRRDDRIHIPWSEAVLVSDGGVPYLAPELQLLFKSKAVRPKDQIDFDWMVPLLGLARRERLRALLPVAHPWRRDLIAG